MNWPEPGIYTDVAPKDYFALTEIRGKIVRSSSTLQAFAADPALFRSGFRKKETKAMKRGSLFDCLLTSPHRFGEDFVKSPYPKFQSNEAKEWKEAQTKSIVTEKELESAVNTIKAIQSDERWQAITEGAVSFQAALRADVNGSPFKGLVDVLPDEDGEFGDWIFDVKRLTSMERIEDVLRTCRRMAYNRQGGLYRGMTRILKKPRNRYGLFIVPQQGPVTPCVLELGEMMLANGARQIMAMDAKLTECERTNHWPGRFDGIKQVEQADEQWEWKEVEEELEEAGELQPQPQP